MVERLLFDKVNGKTKQVPGAMRAGQMAAGLVDKPPRLKAMTPMGVSGVSVLSGYVRTSEKNADWAGTRKWQTIADLSVNVSIVAASVQYFLNMVAHPEWSVKPAEDKGEGKSSKEAEKLAEFVEDVIHDMTTPWQRVVRRATMYRFNGFGLQEWIAKKRDDGKIGFRDIEPRPAFTIERWAIDDDGTVLGVWQRSPQTFELLGLPRGKLIYLVDDTYTDQPDGLGVYRMLAEPFNRLKQYLELEARAYERDMRGIPVGRAPISAIKQMVEEGKMSAQEGEQALQGIRDFITTQVRDKNTSLLMDSMPYENQTADGLSIAGAMQWDVSLLSGGVSALGEMANAIDRLQREMARIIGTEHLMMGDQGGNRALAVDKSRNLYLIANAVLANISDGMDHDLIDPLWSLNGFDPKLKPYFSTEEVAFKDVASIAAALAQMATAGAVMAPDDPAIDDVRDLLGISHAPPPTPAQIGAMQGVPPAAPGAPGGPGLPPGAKKPAGAAPTPPAGSNGKQPGRGSPPETDDAKQQQVAGTTEDQEKKPGKKPTPKTVAKADDDEDEYEFDKANPNHDERGRFTYGTGQSGTQMDLPFESRALTVRSPDATAVAAANDNVSQKDPAVGRKVKQWMAANAREKLVSGIKGVKQVGADLAAGTVRETVVIGAVEAVLHHLVPELPHSMTLPVSAAITQVMETVANKLGLTEHNVKAGFKRGITALINARKSALTLSRFQRASQYGVADIESGRVLTKGDDDVGVVLLFKADVISEDADDAVLHWLHGLYDLVNAYHPKRDKAELDALDAVVHVNRLHETHTEKYNFAHDNLGRFAAADGGGGGSTELTGTANWQRPREENIRQEYKVEYQHHFKGAHGDMFPTEESFVQAIKDAPTVTVDRKMDGGISNRSRTSDMRSLLGLISGYRSYPKFRNEGTLKALEERIKTGAPTDMPIVTTENGRMRVLSGNTRMDIGFMHNDAVKVVMLDVGKYRKDNPYPRAEGGRFGEGPGGGASSEGKNYGLVPGDVQKFHALKNQWAQVNNDLLANIDRPDSPQAQGAMRDMERISKEIGQLHADPGGPEGIGLPGGPRDVTIIGAGPGGLAASIFGGAEGLDTLVVEKNADAGGQARYSSRIENFPGFPVGVTGETLTTNMFEQSARLGAENKLGVAVTGITYDPDTGMKTLTLSNGETIDSRTVILAGGVEFRQPEFEGAEGSGVYVGDGKALAQACQGGDAVVLGGSNGAAQAALGAAQTADHVTLISRSPIEKGMSDYQISALANQPKITVIEEDNIASLHRDPAGNPDYVVTKNGQTIPCDAVGVFAGSVPSTNWLPESISRDAAGRVSTSGHLETSMPGVYAVGDMREGAIGRIGVAVGEGQMALREAHVYLEESRKAKAKLDAAVRSAGDTTKAAGHKFNASDLLTRLFAVDRENPWFGQTVEGVKPPKKKVKKYDPDQPRNEQGEWSSGGGGNVETVTEGHPGEGYSEDAKLVGGKIYTTNIDDAVKALSEDREVVLSQPHEVSTLLDRLAAIGKDAVAKGEKAPTYDLCNVSVEGTNLFCAESYGIPRINMPQLSGKPLPGSKADALPKNSKGEVNLSEEFTKHCAGLAKVTDDTVDASHLKASQNELNGGKVAGIYGAMGAGTLPAGDRLFISRDDYIIDGHHRWAAAVTHEVSGSSKVSTKIDVRRVDIDTITLLDEAKKFAKEWGLPQMAKARSCGINKFLKFNESHDAQGRFSSSGGVGGTSYTVSSNGQLEGYTPAPAKNASELFKRTYDSSVTAEQVMATAGPDVAAKAAAAEAKIAAGTTSKADNQTDGKYNPERVALHEDILNNGGKGDWKGFTPEAVGRALPAAGEQPTLYILGGRGGSGKGWFSKSPDSPFDAGKSMYINCDDFKENLPEYEGWNAPLVHQEAADICDMAYDRARETGLNVTFDGTLRSSEWTKGMIEKYEAAGYRVEGYFMHTAPQVSAVRAMGRFEKTGRYVPADYILESTTNEESFDALTSHFDKWAVYDNNTAKGPVKVASK